MDNNILNAYAALGKIRARARLISDNGEAESLCKKLEVALLKKDTDIHYLLSLVKGIEENANIILAAATNPIKSN